MTGNGQAATSENGAFPLVILIGAPGAGKTTVGTRLAHRLGVGFTDTDAVVESVAGKPVADIFISDGEPEFRRLERDAVAAALGEDSSGEGIRAVESRGGSVEGQGGSVEGQGGSKASGGERQGPCQPGTPAAGVVGLGGGAVMDEQTRARLAGRAVVYLETGFGELAKRVGLDRARPLLIGTNPRAQLKSLLDQRLPVYQGLAWLTVSTDGRDPDDIAAEIASAVLSGRGPGDDR